MDGASIQKNTATIIASLPTGVTLVAAGKTRTARRQSERRRHAEKPQERQSTSPAATRSRREGEADPFEDIEPW